MSAMVSVRKQLPWKRKAAGYSAQRLADAVGSGLSRNMIANAEIGRTELSFDHIIAICRVLEVPITDLVPEIRDVVPHAEDVKALRERLNAVALLASNPERVSSSKRGE